jgi:hypothetical protein
MGGEVDRTGQPERGLTRRALFGATGVVAVPTALGLPWLGDLAEAATVAPASPFLGTTSSTFFTAADLSPESYDPATQGWRTDQGALSVTGTEMRFHTALMFPLGTALTGGSIFGSTPTPIQVTVEQSTGTVVAQGSSFGPAPKLQFFPSPYLPHRPGDDRLVVSIAPGASFSSVEIIYQLPTAGVVLLAQPFRAYDSRTSPQSKLNPDEERTILLAEAAIPAPAGALVTLTLTGTEGDGGFVACFAAGTSYPGTSSVNWTAPDQNIANTVLAATGAGGGVVLRGGVNRTHVVVDVTGFLM